MQKFTKNLGISIKFYGLEKGHETEDPAVLGATVQYSVGP